MQEKITKYKLNLLKYEQLDIQSYLKEPRLSKSHPTKTQAIFHIDSSKLVDLNEQECIQPLRCNIIITSCYPSISSSIFSK